MLCAVSVTTWALKLPLDPHVSWYKEGVYVQLTIHECGRNCSHTLKQIIEDAEIKESDGIDLITVTLPGTSVHKIVEGIPYLKAYTIDLREVTDINGKYSLGSWKNVKNNYVSNVLMRHDEHLGLLDNSIIENFNPKRLYNVISIGGCEPCIKTEIDAYVNVPGMLAYGLQYISELYPHYRYEGKAWWNTGTPNGGNGYTYYTQYFTKVRLSGYVFARDIMASHNYFLTEDGHMRAAPQAHDYQAGYEYHLGTQWKNELAPSNSDPNVIFYNEPAAYGSPQIGAMLGSEVTSFDFTNAQFGYWKEENGKKVFKYYPADMTISMLQNLGADPKDGRGGSVVEVKLPKSPTQYIIPTGFLVNSKYIHEICIPSNYTEVYGFAFLNDKKGISRYTTTAAKDDEMLGIQKGQVIDNGPKTLTLPSTMKFVARGAFSGYGGAALLEDVYVLAEEAPVCEFYAFDQKTYVGEDSHDQGHLIKKGNYVNPNNGMAMLHFPNTKHADGTLNQKEMLNYSDMTRKYRLWDETGAFDNVGNILVWPTQAQYNRSFNQALAGVTWFAWKENVPDPNNNPTGADNPEWSFSGSKNTQESWLAGQGDEKANHNAIFKMAAQNDGFSEQFTTSFDDDNPNSSFNPNGGKGHGFHNNTIDMGYWDSKLLDYAEPESENDRPLSFDFVKYGGWHQFTIAELYDFMLEKPGPNPDKKDYFNFARYNKNIWYAICFPFNMTKAQLLKAFGNTKTGEYPFLSTLASVVRDSRNANITVVMSKNLLKYNLQYESGKSSNTVKYKNFKPDYTAANYGDDDIVIEANKPYFILPCLPEEELVKAATGQRKSDITLVKQEEGKEKVMFPVPTHVHAVKGTYDAYVDDADNAVADTTLAFNYYFVGNYIPQTMPENAYYLKEYQKKNGDYWSSFYRNAPKQTGLMWEDYDAIVIAMIDDNGGSRSKGHLYPQEQHYAGKTHNYIWDVKAHNDWVFFEDTGNEVYAKTAFGMQVEDNFTTSIQLPEDFMVDEDSKVYNLNGQFVGVDADNVAKGVYVVGGKKVVVK